METILSKANTLIANYNTTVRAGSIVPGSKDEISDTVKSLNAKIRDNLVDSLLAKRDDPEASMSDFYRDFLNSMIFGGKGVKEDKDTHELSLVDKELMLSVAHVEKRLNDERKAQAEKSGEKFFAISISQKPTFTHHAKWFFDCLYVLECSKESGVDASKVALKDEFASETALKAREDAGFSPKGISNNKAKTMLEKLLEEFFGEFMPTYTAEETVDREKRTVTRPIGVGSTDVNFLRSAFTKLRKNGLDTINEKTFIDCIMVVAEHRMNSKAYDLNNRGSMRKKS